MFNRVGLDAEAARESVKKHDPAATETVGQFECCSKGACVDRNLEEKHNEVNVRKVQGSYQNLVAHGAH